MRSGSMKILVNVFIIFSPFVLMSQVIVWDGLLLAPLYGIVKGHAIWPGKISHLYSLKKKIIKSILRQHQSLHLDAVYSKYMF